MVITLIIATALAIPPQLDSWEVLDEEPIWIGHLQADNNYWCRSIAQIPGPINEVEALLGDFVNYPEIMDRVSETRIYAPNIVQIVLDMPFPLAHRDYVVQFERKQEEDTVLFDFRSVLHPQAEKVKGSVRLPRAEGQWKLRPLTPSSTEVTYTWNGEILGDFPNWALTRAWATQGAEVMNWLTAALNKDG